jgi:hypothetical protein
MPSKSFKAQDVGHTIMNPDRWKHDMWKPAEDTKEDESEIYNHDVKVQAVGSSRLQSSVSGGLSSVVKEAFECQINATKTSFTNKIPAVAELFMSSYPPEAKIREKVTDLLRDHPSGICLASFARAFEKKFGGSIDDHWLGFGTVYELLISMKDIVELQDLPGGDLLVKGKLGMLKSPGI